MKKNRLIIVICSVIASICFGIVSYGHFYRQQLEMGYLFALLTIAQIVLGYINYKTGKKGK